MPVSATARADPADGPLLVVDLREATPAVVLPHDDADHRLDCASRRWWQRGPGASRACADLRSPSSSRGCSAFNLEAKSGAEECSGLGTAVCSSDLQSGG